MLSVLEDLAFTALPPNDISKYSNNDDNNDDVDKSDGVVCKKQISQNDESVLESANRLHARCHAILHLPYVSSQVSLSWTTKEIIPYLLRCIEEDAPLLSFVVGVALIQLTTTTTHHMSTNCNMDNNAHEMSSLNGSEKQSEETIHENLAEGNSQVCMSFEESLPVIVALCGSHDERIRHFAAQVVIPHICFGVPLHVEIDFTMWEAQYCPFLLSVDERLLNSTYKGDNHNNNNKNNRFNHIATCSIDSLSHLESMQKFIWQREAINSNCISQEYEEHQENDYLKFRENVATFVQKCCDEEMELNRENDKYITINGYFTESAKKKIVELEKQYEQHKQQHLFSERINCNANKKNMYINNKKNTSNYSIAHKSTITEKAFRQLYGLSPLLLSDTSDMSTAILCSRWLLHSIRLWMANTAHCMSMLETKHKANTDKGKNNKENDKSTVGKEEEKVIKKEGNENINNETCVIQTDSDSKSKNNKCKQSDNRITTPMCLSMNDYLEKNNIREALRVRWKCAIKLLELLLTSYYINTREVGVEFLALIVKAISHAQVHWRSYEYKDDKEVESSVNAINHSKNELLLPFAFALSFTQVKEGKCNSSSQLANIMQSIMYKHVAVMCALANVSSYRLENIWHDYTHQIIQHDKISIKMHSSMQTAWMQAKSVLFTLLIQHNYFSLAQNYCNKKNEINNAKLNVQSSHWLSYGTGLTEIGEHSTLTCDVCEFALRQSRQAQFVSADTCTSSNIIITMLPYLPYFVDWNYNNHNKSTEHKLTCGLSVQNVVMLLTSLFIPANDINEYKNYICQNNGYTKGNHNNIESKYMESAYEEELEESENNEWVCELNLSHHELMKQLLFAASRLCTETAFAIHHKWIYALINIYIKYEKNNKNNSKGSIDRNSLDNDDDDDEEMCEYVEFLLHIMFTFIQRVCTVLALSPSWKVRWELFHQLPFVYKSLLHLLLTPAQLCMSNSYVYLCSKGNKETMEAHHFTTLKMIKLSQRYVEEFLTFQQQLRQMVEDQSHSYVSEDENCTQNSVMCLCALNDNESEVRCVALESACHIAELCTHATLSLSSCMNKFTAIQPKNLNESDNKSNQCKEEITDTSLLHLLLLQLITTLCKVTRTATFLSIGAYYDKSNNNNNIIKKSKFMDEYKIGCSSVSSLAHLTQLVYTLKSIPLFHKYNVDKEWNWLKESLITAFAPLLTTEHVSCTSKDVQLSTYESNDKNNVNDNENVIEVTLIQKYTDLLLLMCVDKFETTAQVKLKEHLEEKEYQIKTTNNNDNDEHTNVNKVDGANDVINIHLQKLIKYLEHLSQHKLWRVREQYVWLLSDMCYKFMSSHCALQNFHHKHNVEYEYKSENDKYKLREQKSLEELKEGNAEKSNCYANDRNACDAECYMWLYNFALKYFIPLLVNVMFDKTHVIRITALNATRQLCAALEQLCTNNNFNTNELFRHKQSKTCKLCNTKEGREEEVRNDFKSLDTIKKLQYQSEIDYNIHKYGNTLIHNKYHYDDEEKMKTKTHNIKHRTFAERVIWPALKHNLAAWSSFSHRVALLQIVLMLELNKKHVLMPLLQKLSIDKVVNVRMAVAKTIYTLLQRTHDNNADETSNNFDKSNNNNTIYNGRSIINNNSNCNSSKVVLSKSDRNGPILRILRSLLTDSSSDVRDEATRAIAICY